MSREKTEIKDTAENLVSGIFESGKTALSDIAEDAREVVEDAFKTGKKKSTKVIKKYPFETVLAGVGVGIVIGVVLARR